MMRLWLITALVLCFFASSIFVEGRNNSLRRALQEDTPVASPTNREGEPVDVFVEPPASPSPTTADVAAAPTPSPANDAGPTESPTANEAIDNAGGNDQDVQPTAAPTEPDDADEGGDTVATDAPVPDDKIPETTPGAAGGDGGGNDTGGTLAPPNDETPESTPASANDQGDGSEGTAAESTPSPSIASTDGVVPAPTPGFVPAPTPAPMEAIATPAPTPDAMESPTDGGGDDGGGDSPTDGGDDSPTGSPTEDGDKDDFNEWDNYTPPTEPPVVYVPPDEEGDPIKNEANNATGPWIHEGESPEEMIHDRNVLIAVGSLCGVGILLMIITAHQMVENPDGCCAGVCRLITGCTCCILRTICFPCRACCGGGGRKRRGRQHQMLDNGSNYTHDLELS